MMKKFFLNYLLVFSLLFSSLPGLAHGEEDDGMGSLNKMANVVLVWAIGLSAAYKLATCESRGNGLTFDAVSFYVFNAAAVAYMASETYFTFKDEEDVDEALELEGDGNRHEQANAYLRAAKAAEKNAENADEKAEIRFAISIVMLAAAAIALIEAGRYELMTSTYPLQIKAACDVAKNRDEQASNWDSLSNNSESGKQGMHTSLISYPGVVAGDTSKLSSTAGKYAALHAALVSEHSFNCVPRFGCGEEPPAMDSEDTTNATKSNTNAIQASSNGTTSFLQCQTDCAGPQYAACAAKCPGETDDVGKQNVQDNVDLAQQENSDTISLRNDYNDHAKKAYEEFKDDTFPAFKMTCGEESDDYFNKGKKRFDEGKGKNCDDLNATPAITGDTGLASKADEVKDITGQEEEEANDDSLLSTDQMLSVIKLLVGFVLDDGLGEFIQTAISIAQVVMEVMTGSTQEYLPLSRVVAYGLFGIQALLAANTEKEDAEDYRKRAEIYMRLYNQLNKKKNTAAAEGKATTNANAPKQNIAAIKQNNQTQASLKKKKNSRVGATLGDTCFTVSKDKGTQPDKDCSCKKSKTCGEVSIPPETETTSTISSFPGLDSVREVADYGVELANAILQGDANARKIAVSNITQKAGIVNDTYNRAHEILKNAYKVQGKTLPNLADQRNKLYKNLNSVALESLKHIKYGSAKTKKAFEKAFANAAKQKSSNYKYKVKTYVSRKSKVRYTNKGYKKRLSSNLKTSSSKAQYEDNDMIEIMKKKYNYSKVNSINRNSKVSIFKIISNRYLRSTTQKLLNNIK